MLELRRDRNYAATIIRVDEVYHLTGLDNLVAIRWGGMQALVPKDTPPGALRVLFPTEVQLSEVFARDNNLYSSAERNKDTDQKGYLANNRRVRAIKLRGYQSNALVLPVESLGLRPEDVTPGIEFDTVNGVEISRKYEPPAKPQNGGNNLQARVWRRVEEKFLPQHFDTDQFFRNLDKYSDGDELIVTQKLHGSSVRLGRVPVRRKLTWRDRLAAWFGVPVREYDVDVVGGSRKVIKDPNNPDQNHFYSEDIWSEAAKEYGDAVPENVVVYGELIGWVGDSPIQPGYTYNLPRGEYELYVYRVAVLSPSGLIFDLSWDGVREFCRDRGWCHVPELARLRYSVDVTPEEVVAVYLDVRFEDHAWEAVPLSAPGTVDEGVCLRREGIVPYVTKAKSPIFLNYETKELDAGKEILS